MVKLYIDTRDNKKTIIKITKDGKEFGISEEKEILRSQIILPLIEKLLKQTNTRVYEINEIKVEKGPGSFTGIRVGVAIANALGFSLHKKINGLKIGTIQTPVYS